MGRCLGCIIFSGWHHHTLSVASLIFRTTLSVFGFRPRLRLSSKGRCSDFVFRISLSRHHAFWSWAFSLLAQASSLRHSRIPRGMDVVTHFLLNVTDSNNLVWISVYIFFPFCHCNYYNTPPIYIDWRERAGWDIFWSSPTLPRAALCRKHGCLYFLCRRYRHHTLHTHRWVLTHFVGWMEGMEGEERETFCWYSILLSFYLSHSTSCRHPPSLYICFIFSTYIPSSIRLLEELNQNHCHHCSAPMELSLYVPLSCATKILN
jgi:hypothetical protein